MNLKNCRAANNISVWCYFTQYYSDAAFFVCVVPCHQCPSGITDSGHHIKLHRHFLIKSYHSHKINKFTLVCVYCTFVLVFPLTNLPPGNGFFQHYTGILPRSVRTFKGLGPGDQDAVLQALLVRRKGESETYTQTHRQSRCKVGLEHHTVTADYSTA